MTGAKLVIDIDKLVELLHLRISMLQERTGESELRTAGAVSELKILAEALGQPWDDVTVHTCRHCGRRSMNPMVFADNIHYVNLD